MRLLALAPVAFALAAGCGPGSEVDGGGRDGGDPCQAGDESAVLTGSTRVEYATHTDISISLGAPPCDRPVEAWRFAVSMTNHTCSIPGYDDGFETKVVLETSDGVSRADARWDVSSTDEHHPAGTLVFEARDVPLIGCDTEWVAAVVTDLDLAEGEHLRFEWSGEIIDPLRVCPGA